MTPEERLAELGVDLSDLPQADGRHLVYDRASRIQADRTQRRWHGVGEYCMVDIVDEVSMLEDYVLHLAELLDRAERKLVNVTGERDFLLDYLDRAAGLSCELCALDPDDPDCCIDEDFRQVPGKTFVWGGVPEDWEAKE